MDKGTITRLTIHKVLYDVYKLKKKINDHTIQKRIDIYDQKDRSFIIHVSLSSMRYFFHTQKIVNRYLLKKPKLNEKLLLISSITQLIFLDFKSYAVVNSSVEIAKKINVYPGLINATLKNILKDKDKLKKIKINYNDLPNWFLENTTDLTTIEKKDFLKNFCKEPDLHLVFKSAKNLDNFEEEIIKTSDVSGFLKEKRIIEKIPSFKKGNWWIQDFSSFFTLSNKSNLKNFNSFVDLCAAPGGKSFQILNNNNNIVINDKSKHRIKKLEENLERLNFRAKVLNYDILKISPKNKYDFVILDAPCSSIGTIRKNPEIFFRNFDPKIDKLTILQEKLLWKASEIVNNNGMILYMVCSFFKNETINVIEKFIHNKKRFKIVKLKNDYKNVDCINLLKNGYFRTLPTTIHNKTIDGYFAVLLQRLS